MGLPINEMYKQRSEFVIVALTGISGSGCSALAELMERPFAEWKTEVRAKEDLRINNDSTKEDVLFYKKYELAYSVCEKQFNQFQVIKYRNVLLFYSLLKFACKKDDKRFLENIKQLVKQKFDKSHERKEDTEDVTYVVDNDLKDEDIINLGFTDISHMFYELADLNDDPSKYLDYRKKLYQAFFNNHMFDFCEKFYDLLKERDYYAKNFFVHRLANAIRATGDPLAVVSHKDLYESDHIFKIVDFINQIIKGCHEDNKNAPRRFVIDSVRNSLEILFLRERYNAFYMVALHNDGNEKKLITEKVFKAVYKEDIDENSKDKLESLKPMLQRINWLNRIESSIEDFEKGLFYGADISRCVAESEIHIINNCKSELVGKGRVNTFFTTAEQWMKFYALIVRPGLITPSRDERCMAVANVAKLNSGCISRKVGCTIVDSSYAVQSVGWNDPPSSQLPCQLRYVDEFLETGNIGEDPNYQLKNHIYSNYELAGMPTINGNTFKQCLTEEFSDGVVKDELANYGLRYSYCFRSRYNKYKGQKDQVNTRSLHAEENTMLRLSKVGGKGLDGGIMYVTASPCVLCSKKAYQIGIKEIVYLDPYTDIAPDLIIHCGWNPPKLRPFMGAIGTTFDKLYRPFMPFKDELAIWEKNFSPKKSIKGRIEELRRMQKNYKKEAEKLQFEIDNLEKEGDNQ